MGSWGGNADHRAAGQEERTEAVVERHAVMEIEGLGLPVRVKIEY